MGEKGPEVDRREDNVLLAKHKEDRQIYRHGQYTRYKHDLFPENDLFGSAKIEKYIICALKGSQTFCRLFHGATEGIRQRQEVRKHK